MKVFSKSSLIIIVFFALIPNFSQVRETLVVDSHEWKFGTIDKGKVISTQVKLSNTSNKSITLELIPDCDCTTVNPKKLIIGAGENAKFEITYDSKEDVGKITKGLTIKTNLLNKDEIHFVFSGIVIQSTKKN